MSTQTKDGCNCAPETVEAVERTRARRTFVPAVDIFETKETIVLTADMPGVDEKSVEIILDKNVLTLTGNVEELKFDGCKPAHVEYETGDYQRSFTLSNEIDTDRIEAGVKNGVLRLTLPKAESARSKKIEVKVG